MPVNGPQEPPLLAAYRAAGILSGQADKEIKDRDRAARVQADADGEASTSKDGAGSGDRKKAKASPLARVLRLRLEAAVPLLTGPESENITTSLGTATDDDDDKLHFLTAQAALLCTCIIKRELSSSRRTSDEPLTVGAKDRKSTTTLLSLASQWGFGPALLAYDATLASMAASRNNGSRLEEVDVQDQRRKAAMSDFAVSVDNLQNIFSLAFALFGEAVTLSAFDTEFVLNPQQPIASQLFGTAIRLAMGPSTPAPSSKGKETPPSHVVEARQLLSLLLKSLPPSALLPLLSSASAASPSAAQHNAPPVPPFVRQFTNRILSAQLLKREGVLSLVSTVMGLDSERSASTASGTDTSPTRKLDRLVTLLVTPPPGMQEEQFLQDHTVPSLLYFLTGGGAVENQSAQARETFATVTAYTFQRLLGAHQGLLKARLQPFVWGPLLGTPSIQDAKARGESAVVLTSPADVAKAVEILELVVLYAPPIASDWVQWVVSPVATHLWELLEVVSASGQPSSRKISEVRSTSNGPSRVKQQMAKQLEALLRTWVKSADGQQVTSFFSTLRREGACRSIAEPTAHFSLQDDGLPALIYSKPPFPSTEAVDADRIMAQMSAGISHTSLDDKGDEEAMKHSMQMLSALQDQSSARPSPTLVCKVLKQAQRSDVAGLLLPDLLEEYIATKTRSSAAAHSTQQLLSSLQLIVALLDTFEEDIVKRDPAQALRFVNICLGGEVDLQSGTSKPSDRATKPGSDEIPFISASKSSDRTPMNGLLNIDREAGTMDASTSSNEPEAVDEEIARPAVDLLLSVLESQPEFTPGNAPLLSVIDRKLAGAQFSAHEDDDLRRVVKEARVVLLARRQQDLQETSGSDDVPIIQTSSSKARQEIDEQYQEALKLLQDPILPVRAHGLVMLKDLAAIASSSKEASNREKGKAVQTLLPTIIELLMRAIEDEESYLYMNAIQGLKEVMLYGQPYLTQLVDSYVGTDTCHFPLSRQEVDKRLRLGEALLNAVQALGEGGAVYANTILPPLLQGLRESRFPTTLRSSVLSLLGTCVEAFPVVFATTSLTTELAEACMHILTLESVARPTESSHAAVRNRNVLSEQNGSDGESDSDDLSPEELKRRLNYAPGADDATGVESTFPQLRRGALLLLSLLVGGAISQLEMELEKRQNHDEQEADHGLIRGLRLPGGGVLPRLSGGPEAQIGNALDIDTLLFSPAMTAAVRRVLVYVQQNDTDSVVRHQASEGLVSLEAFELALVRLGVGA